MRVEQTYGKGKTAGILLRGLVLAGVVSMVILLILAFVMLKLQPDAEKIELGIMIVYGVSCFFGGWYSGRKMGRKKYLWGLIVGVLYFLLLFAVSGMSDREVQPELLHSLTALILCGVGGMLGGMVAR